MKKIQKINHAAAQSVFAFYCPCSGYCSTICACTTPDSLISNNTNSLSQYNPHATTTV